MKKLNVTTALVALSLLSSVFIMEGCKKEAPITPINTVLVNGDQTADSAYFFKGYLGNEVVKFEGSAISYNAYVDPDSSQNSHGCGNGTGNTQTDNDAYYTSGSKWVSIPNVGLPVTNASLELRSLAVRVFVSPVNSQSANYYNLLGLETYAVSTSDNPSKGAYISLHDKNGKLWTSAGNQDGSVLTVTSRGANMGTYTVLTGTITAKMYDADGNVKQLTGVSFTAALGI
jgi:hypothetical protein